MCDWGMRLVVETDLSAQNGVECCYISATYHLATEEMTLVFF